MLALVNKTLDKVITRRGKIDNTAIGDNWYRFLKDLLHEQEFLVKIYFTKPKIQTPQFQTNMPPNEFKPFQTNMPTNPD